MKDMLPVATPARTRVEQAPATLPDRRREDDDKGFANSLASARAVERRASGQSQGVKAHGDDPRVQRDGDGQKLVQARAQVQSLMLHGAMKFAATRGTERCADSGAAVEVPVGAVMSLPATPEQDRLASTPESSARQVPIGDLLLSAPAMPDATGDVADVALAVPADALVQSLPDAPLEPAVDAEAVITTVPDMSDSNAVAAAAMQLVASLPIAVPPTVIMNAPALVDDAMDADQSIAQSGTTPGPWAAAANEGATMPLVEDHFDAAAKALETVILTTGPVRVPTVHASPAAAGAKSTRASAAIAATPASSTAARAVQHSDVHAVQSDVARLSPEFRDRLQRVMDRMQRDFGHEVTVVETVRSQARQDALYAQGRTAPGTVVTWTKHSRHAHGHAADLLVDGQWQNPAGYAHLAAVAKQEGLRTLGSRDPGHVELPTEGSVSGETLGNLLSDLQGDAGDAARQLRAEVYREPRETSADATARVANVAQVARVARVADVAKVADVARPGASTRHDGDAGSAVSPLAVSGPMPMGGAQDLAGAMRVATPTMSVNMADRIAHLLDLQATQSAKPLNGVLLRMDNANGIEDQLRIDTRGTSVDARLGLGNAQQAAALTDRVGELREALERRGLTADAVRVQTTPASRATDSVNFARAVAPTLELAAMRAAADSQAQGNMRDQSSRDAQQRESHAREQERHTQRSSPDDSRHRSRREQPEDRR